MIVISSTKMRLLRKCDFTVLTGLLLENVPNSSVRALVKGLMSSGQGNQLLRHPAS